MLGLDDEKKRITSVLEEMDEQVDMPEMDEPMQHFVAAIQNGNSKEAFDLLVKIVRKLTKGQ